MATGSSAIPSKAGFNQSGGGYYIIISSIYASMNTYTPGTGSGGATTAGTFATFAAAAGDGNVSSVTVTGPGRIIKDMGKTVVSAGRTFRKFQVVLGTDNSSSPSFGVTGATTTNYLTTYLETGREGANADGPMPQIARYM